MAFRIFWEQEVINVGLSNILFSSLFYQGNAIPWLSLNEDTPQPPGIKRAFFLDLGFGLTGFCVSCKGAKRQVPSWGVTYITICSSSLHL